jgi:hypothetical protein
MPDNPARLIAEKDPTPHVQHREQHKQQDVQEPKAACKIIDARNWGWNLV